MTESKRRTGLRSLRSRVDYWAEGPMLDFVEDLNGIMKRNNISQAELAKRTGTKDAYVSRILEGDTNFTIKSMVKLAFAVDHKIRIHLAPLKAQTRWLDQYIRKTSTETVDGFTQFGSTVGAVKTDSPTSRVDVTVGVAKNG